MKKENVNVVYCPPCGESTLKGGKGVVNKGNLFDNPPSALRATSPAGGEVNGGFTLIELLVVVLIISILAAVAVPQYKRAVVKTRIYSLLPVVKSIIKAKEIYYLANGSYETTPSSLDIQMPAECKNLDESHRLWLCGTDTLLYISHTQVGIYYCPNNAHSWDACISAEEMIYTTYYAHSTSNPGAITCYYYNNSSIGKYLCNALPK